MLLFVFVVWAVERDGGIILMELARPTVRFPCGRPRFHASFIRKYNTAQRNERPLHLRKLCEVALRFFCAVYIYVLCVWLCGRE